MTHISLQSEYIATILGVPITNTFFTAVVVSGILLFCGALFYFAGNWHRACAGMITKILRVLVYELLNGIDQVTKDRSLSKKVFPVIATLFLFIVTANLLGLVPGFLGSFFVDTSQGSVALFRSPNSDLTITIALAFFAVASIQVFSIRALGVRGYLGRFLNFTNPTRFFIGLFEILSEGVKLLSFSFRLFGNVFAGEVLLLVVAFLVPYVIPIPFMLLEVFVGLLQAFVFAMLALTFIKLGATRQQR